MASTPLSGHRAMEKVAKTHACMSSEHLVPRLGLNRVNNSNRLPSPLPSRVWRPLCGLTAWRLSRNAGLHIVCIETVLEKARNMPSLLLWRVNRAADSVVMLFCCYAARLWLILGASRRGARPKCRSRRFLAIDLTCMNRPDPQLKSHANCACVIVRGISERYLNHDERRCIACYALRWYLILATRG
jgi:hypothetical protein